MLDGGSDITSENERRTRGRRDEEVSLSCIRLVAPGANVRQAGEGAAWTVVDTPACLTLAPSVVARGANPAQSKYMPKFGLYQGQNAMNAYTDLNALGLFREFGMR